MHIHATQEITGIDDHAKVVQLLSSRHWELEAAVHDAFNEKEGVPSVFAPDPAPPLPPGPQPGLRRRPMASSAPGQDSATDPSPSPHGNGRGSRSGAVVAQQQNWWEWLVNVAIFPLRFVLNAASDLLQFVSKSPSLAWPTLARQTISHLHVIHLTPNNIYSSDNIATYTYQCSKSCILFSSVDLVFGFQPIAQNPLADVRQFVHEFESEYGRTHPPFVESTYEQVRR